MPLFSSAPFTLQRNAKTHLSKRDSIEFQNRWRAIKATSDFEVGKRHD